MKKTSITVISLVSILVISTSLITPQQATISLPQAQEHATSSITEATFDQRISTLMKLAGFRSLSACIIKDDQIIWSNGYGYYDFSEKKQSNPDTIYILASITKTIVGTALLQLYESGLCDLDDDVNLYLPFELRNPNFPDDPITIRMLLSHTSSLKTNSQTQYYWMNISGDPPYGFFPDPYLREFLLPGGSYYDPGVWSTYYRPGEHAMYANVGFDLISYLVELISGEPFLQYCNTHIFTPLEMHDTSFNLSTLDIEKVAIPYQRYAGKYYTIDTLTFIYGDNTPSEVYYRCRFYPSGGLYSTITDLSHFLIAHMNGGVYKGIRILEEETLALMHTIQPNNTIGYGLAWEQARLSPHLLASGHSGDLPGADTWMLYNQTQDCGVIYLANGNPGYGFLPHHGMLLCWYILYSLFTKEMTFTSETHQEGKSSSDLFVHPFRMVSHSLLE